MSKPTSMRATPSKTLWMMVGAVLASTGLVGTADAKPAQCVVEVEGFSSFRGSCNFEAQAGGSFALTKPALLMLHANDDTLYADEDSVFVKVLAPNIALLFGIGGAHQTGTYLATLQRVGSCWVSRPPKDEINGNARVCAR